MFDELLILTAVLLGISFVRLARRMEPGQRGYMVAVAVVFALALGALARGSQFLAVIAMSFTVLIVILPWTLEALARAAFGRGKLTLAVWMAGLRAILMPGAGLSRQQEILRGLAMLERDGVDQALDHFRKLADDADDGELALINEQIVSMFLYGQRWDEGIAHYEARFHPRYAALRPALALGLLRAYGESGHLERAAGLLRALEEGPVGADPRAVGLLSQARLTFLAYAGASRTVTAALSEQRRELLGLSAASSALFRGIAHLRAGQTSEAQRELATVEQLAGSADDRVVDASRRSIAKLEGYGDAAHPVDLGPDLRKYVDAVADRLDQFLRTSPAVSRRLPRFGAPLLVAGCVIGYLMFLGVGRGGYGLVDLGALLPALLQAHEWYRVAAGVWLHADPIATLLNVYALWLAAPLFERVHGTGRLVVAAGGGGSLGLVTAAVFAPTSVAIISGANLMVMAVVAGATWTLLPVHSPGLGSGGRRSLLVPLLLVFGAQVLCLVPGLLSLHVPPAGLAMAAGFGVLVAMVPSGRLGRIVAAVAVPVAIVHMAALGFAGVAGPGGRVALTKMHLVATQEGTWTLPMAFEPSADHDELWRGDLPMLPGAVDAIGLRGGDVVQALAFRGPAPASGDEPIVIATRPALGHELGAAPGPELPAAIAEAVEEAGVDVQTFTLRRNGEEVAVVVQRRVGDQVFGLVASPPSALHHAAGVYAAVIVGDGPRR